MGSVKISCSLENSLALLTGKWKICILTTLYEKPHRFGELKKRLPNVSIKMLSQALKELTTSDLIHRKDYNVKPPKVIYSITRFGESLKPVIKELERWESKYLAQIHTSLMRKHYNRFTKKNPVPLL